MEINRKFQAAYQKISAAQEILLVGHVSPDHDALASLGVMLALSGRLSIKTLAYAGNKPSSGYEFVPYEKLVSSDKPTDLSKFSVIIILDCGSLARTGLELEIKEALANRKISGSQQPFFIELDHHEPHDHYADIEIRLPHKASTTEIIYDFFQFFFFYPNLSKSMFLKINKHYLLNNYGIDFQYFIYFYITK